MCGIFGIVHQPTTSENSGKNIRTLLTHLALYSESRGKDSSGFAFRNYEMQQTDVIKGDIPIHQLIRKEKYLSILNENLVSCAKKNPFLAFGHARLVTNGSQLQAVNNQPVVKDNMLLVHNGIIVNADALWEQNPDLQRHFLIDTEIIPSLISKQLNHGETMVAACNKSFNVLEGTYSIALLFNDLPYFVLATNNGSLYFVQNNESLVFASEAYFLKKLYKKSNQNIVIQQIKPNHGVVVGLSDFSLYPFSKEDNVLMPEQTKQSFELKLHYEKNTSDKSEVVIDPSLFINRNKESHLFDLLENNTEAIRKLKRCTKCLLPETFPFIEYDEKGVCNYCRNYKQKNTPKSLYELAKLVEPYRRKDGKPDCIVPFSGGRDSSYSLHIIKKELGMNPIAYTYDWGMVTDLARRNIARVCGKLEVENIIVAADIRQKRKFVKMNVEAWLRQPNLGMIPLFMSGDKAFHHYLIQVQKQTGIDLNIWGSNELENTNFKTGFAGAHPDFDKRTLYSMSNFNRIRLLSFLVKSVIKNPHYINESIVDNLKSQYSRSFQTKHDIFEFYHFLQWNETKIENLLESEYQWERAIDTKSTWRIGDGTASFYNYIYYTVAGFTENDTFRSNQIREGLMDRETALKKVEEENFPRYETLRWYLEILGLDFEKTIKIINQIPKLYSI